MFLFRRGDRDIAVFQAFKEIEVAVGNSANTKGAGYPELEVGTPLMRKAFHPETGPLADKSLATAEREVEMHLFAAAIGHAKNPTSHRDVAMTALEAARLIVFASHLFEIVERRTKSLKPMQPAKTGPCLPSSRMPTSAPCRCLRMISAVGWQVDGDRRFADHRSGPKNPSGKFMKLNVRKGGALELALRAHNPELSVG